MRKLVGILALGVMFGLASTASAITADGDWSDWFSYGGNTGFNTWNENLVTVNNLNIRSLNDEEGPTPGGGGQTYDIEQIFYMYDDTDPNTLSGGKLYIGLVTGFPAAGVDADNLYPGDMFVDFGNTGGYDLAIATSTSTVNADLPGGVDNDYFGNNYYNDGTANWQVRDPSPFVAQTPWRVVRNAAIENLFSTQVAWGGMGRHNFLEICIDVDGGLEDILTNQQGGLGLHWTMECGNDVINVRDDNPFVPVPEPSTFALLGMGMLGVALRRKFAA